MRSIPRSMVIAALAVALALPVSAGDADHPRPAALEGSSVVWCGDVELITAPPDRYRDTPVYLGNPPTEKVRRWAKKQPGFQELWIDRDNFGWITVGFIRGASRRQADLEREFPSLGVVAVDVPYTKQKLRRLQRRVTDAVFPDVVASGGTSAATHLGYVELWPNVVDDELVALLETKFAGEPICMDGPDPSTLVKPGPQPTEGDGWLLVGHHQGAEPYFETGVASQPAELEELWARANMPGIVPEVDFDGSVVLWFAQGHGSSCDELRLDDVVIDAERSLIYPHIVLPGNQTVCTSDLAGAYQYFVALERDRLPAPPVSVQLGAYDPPAGERTVIDTDLSEPGSTPQEGQVHRDLSEPTPGPMRSGDFGRASGPYLLDTRCGISYLGELRAIGWVSDVPRLPKVWADLVDESGFILVTIKMRGGDKPFVDATANGHTVRSLPWRGEPPVCESAQG